MNASTLAAAELPAPLAALVREYLAFAAGGREPEPRFSATPIAGDGSDRHYYRVAPAAAPAATFIAVEAAAGGEKYRQQDGRRLTENHSFMLIARHLAACGLPVPAVLAADLQARHYLLADLGQTTVYDFVRQHGWQPAAVDLYRRLVRLLASVQQRASAAFDPRWAYGGGFYDHKLVVEGELEYFLRAYVADYLGLSLGDRTRQAVREDCRRLAARALEAPAAHFLHRDFQSKNLMLHGGQLWLLDFQGARRGPLYYDLAALLNDPYVDMPAAVKEELLQDYYARAAAPLALPAPAVFHRFFTLFSLIRNLQVLGAFAFLSRHRQRPHFRQYIPAARRSLTALAAREEIRRAFPALARLITDLPA